MMHPCPPFECGRCGELRSVYEVHDCAETDDDPHTGLLDWWAAIGQRLREIVWR